jgi:hypothetical protein
MKQGCYEEVDDSLMQERRMRKAVRKKRREGSSGYLLTAKEAMELSSLKRDGSPDKSPGGSSSKLQLIDTGRDGANYHDAPRAKEADMPVTQIFYSMLLTIAKTSAPLKRRLLQEMKSSGANKHCRNVKHKQDTLGSLCGLIRPGDFFLLWDLRDMFHQVSVHPTMRPMLRALVWKIVRLATKRPRNSFGCRIRR